MSRKSQRIMSKTATPKSNSVWNNIKFTRTDVSFSNDEKLVTGELYAIVKEEDVQKQVQKISNDLHAKGKIGTIGVSLHYKLPNIFLPAIETPFGAPVKLFDPSNSETTKAILPPIDGVIIYIIENRELPDDKTSYRKPKKKVSIPDKSMFKK